MNNPILATASWTEGGKRYTMKVEGGLHYIRGNSKPHFSITADIRENGREYMGGCCHPEIEERFPGQFSDLIALHLSDIDGTPMYAVENGYYWAAGANGGNQQQYHGGNGTSPRTRYECAEILAKHLRISVQDAEALAARGTKAAVAETVEASRVRWNAEALACIAKHGLVVYGDKWAA